MVSVRSLRDGLVARAWVGVTGAAVTVAEVTFKTAAGLVILPDVAVIEVCPTATAVASPLVPVALLMVAKFVRDEFQLTEVVTSCPVLSLAVNCCLPPMAILGFVGVIAMDVIGAVVTVKEAVLNKVPNVALIVVVPAARAVASPFEPAASLMVATSVRDELHVTAAVTSRVVLLSLQIPVAVNCCVAPGAILVFAGVTACMDDNDKLRTQELLPLLPGVGHWETRLWPVHTKQLTISGNPW